MSTRHNTVSNLTDAVKRASSPIYEGGCLGFLISPVSSRGGGRPWWLGVHGEKGAWLREGEDGVRVPVLDEALDALPPLPPSPLKQWLFGFVDHDGNMLRPYLLIDENFKHRGGEVIDVTATSEEKKEPPPAASPDLLGLLTQLLQQKDKHASELIGIVVGALATVQKEMANVLEIRKSEAVNLLSRVKNVETALQDALESNANLSTTLSELKQDSQLFLTLQEIFRGKPEVFVATVKDLLGEVITKLKS